MLLRSLLALALVGALSACSPSPLLRGSLDTLGVAFGGPPTLELSREQVEAIPHPQLKVGTPYGEAGMVLGRVEDGQELWVASTRQVLVIHHGLVRRTVGFPAGLAGSRFVGNDPFAEGLHRQADGSESVREVDWQEEQRFGVRLHSRFRRHGLETVEILGVPHRLLRIDERVRAEGVAFKATNRYWVDPRDGFVMLSLQHPAPGLPITLTQLRPYRETAR